MKSFNGLYEAMTENEEIEASIEEAAKRKKKRSAVKRALANKPAKAAEIKKNLPVWKPPYHPRKARREGSHKKERTIEKPNWDCEQIVHHMLVRQLKKIIIPRTYRYACGVLKGRGALFAARALKRWADSYHGKKFYVAELDVKKNYDSIDLELLKKMLSKTIRDKRFLSVLFRVIDNSGPGLPKGFYTSPWLATFYISSLDYYIVQQLKPDHYLRFVDNLYLFSTNKKELHAMVDAVEEFLSERLHMHLNEGWQVFRYEYEPKPFQRPPRRDDPSRYYAGPRRKPDKKRDRGRPINALGYVVHRNRITMRKGILERARAKALRMARLRRCRRIDAATMLAYKGWFDHTNTYKYFQKYIKPNVSMRYCRRRISVLAKRERMENDRLAYCA